jgi:hypothetical protein
MIPLRHYRLSMFLGLAFILGTCPPGIAQSAPDAPAPQAAITPTPVAAKPASASDLYQTWQQNNRTDHSRAYEAAQTYLRAYPDGAQASELMRWVVAYEKVIGHTPAPPPLPAHVETVAAATPVPAPMPVQAPTPVREPAAKPPMPALPNNTAGGPSLTETQAWLIGWLNAHSHPVADSWSAWRFDGCRLYAVTVQNGCYRRTTIDFSEVDPSALRTYSISTAPSAKATPGESLAIMLRSSSDAPVYHADQAAKNLGSPQSPVPGSMCPREAMDESPEAMDLASQGYFVTNASADPFAKEDINHALNGVQHLVKLCGGKASPF